MWGNPTMVNEVGSEIGPIGLATVPETHLPPCQPRHASIGDLHGGNSQIQSDRSKPVIAGAVHRAMTVSA